ncbi:MAG: ribosome-associated translation inhibitor RaiA [Zetaproteobacteria bacterium]|nr:MAG: ribosome-associated translation inhibitor RaiA [Zetaproteobacteria bacterium]
MQLPLQITAHNVELSDIARDTIRKKAEKLDQFFDHIMRCRVTVDAPHRNQNKGILYNVRIDVTVPDDELVVKREQHEDLYVACREAFDAMRRQLQSYVDKRRHNVKQRSTAA